MIRTRPAGALRAEHAGQAVTLAGWVARRRDHGGVAFLDLRDASGVVQVVVRDHEVAGGLRSEYCLRVVGDVSRRPAGNENAELPTGEIEVVATEVEVLSEADPLPFPIEATGTSTGEIADEIRLRYRYLDLRREGPAHALRVRSQVNRLAREVLGERDFVEVETPYLTRSTPEGARDFLVPVRLQPGTWYALPQSPQLFKQLLMVAGLERYYQIARCFRDEDFRADRQPEFTQLDIEMSFVEQDDVIELAEEIVARLWRDLAGHDLPRPVRRLTYAESMARYGTDKPDLRFGVELVDCTEYFRDTPFRVFQQAASGGHVGAVVMPGGAGQARRELDGWQEWARSRGAKGLAYVLVQDDGNLGGPVAKNLSEPERAGLVAHVGAAPGDCVFFAAGPRQGALALLGATRLEIGRRVNLFDPSRWEFVWVLDAPMFEADTGEAGASALGGGKGTPDGGWTAVHHPFTAPQEEWAETFQDAPGEALAYAYDIVCNGNEIGGGSIRIHRAEMQQRVFDVIGLTKDDAEAKFGFLLQAFKFGPPPHGGIALGWDRICALLAGADSIREVIAFPKAASGSDPLTGAPTPITAAQRQEAGVDAPPPPDRRAAPPNEPGGEVIPDERR